LAEDGRQQQKVVFHRVLLNRFQAHTDHITVLMATLNERRKPGGRRRRRRRYSLP
jgi:hypothetical protein